jgi:hypothetical protein
LATALQVGRADRHGHDHANGLSIQQGWIPPPAEHRELRGLVEVSPHAPQQTGRHDLSLFVDSGFKDHHAARVGTCDRCQVRDFRDPNLILRGTTSQIADLDGFPFPADLTGRTRRHHMMTVNGATQAPSVEPSGSSSKNTQPPPATTLVTDTVQISSSALAAAKAALEESTETANETAREARAGDPQAQRLLAKQAAAKAAER